jgi:hypothetical protein
MLRQPKRLNQLALAWQLLGHYTSPAACVDDLKTKRGLAFRGDDHAPDIQLLTSDDSEISWYYTWSTWPSEAIGESLAFVPLLHGVQDAEDKELQSRLGRLPDISTHLLTFNEPDGEKDTGGSSISPEDAAQAYIDYIVPLRDADRKWAISHPSVTGSPRGLEWLQDFNESCYEIADDGCPTDFVAVHWYGAFEGLEGWLQTLRDFYGDMAPDAQYWITEVALPAEDEEATLAMANQSISYLDGDDDVQAYAWFGAFRTDEANEWTGESVSFFNDDGELTELGALYLGGEDKGFEEGNKGEGDDSSASSALPSSTVLAVTLGLGVLLPWF